MVNNYDELVGSEAQKQLLYRIRKAAEEDCHVLITGETGTGKELVAKLIHNNSRRKKKNFVPIDFAAISESLYHSELFGHCKGAFTGALTDRQGLLTQANEGTAFLDEFAELSNEKQATLLRFLETNEIRTLGKNSLETVNVRPIIATIADLEKDLDSQMIRPDLYYRLTRSIRIDIPPLRHRTEDLPELFLHFFKQALNSYGRDLVKVDKSIYEYLSAYTWPGNVRELRNFVEDIARWLDKDCKVLDIDGFLSLKNLNKEKRKILSQCKIEADVIKKSFVERRLQILQYASDLQKENFTISEYQQLCKNYCHTTISKSTALRDLKKLCAKGLIKLIGGGRASRYMLEPRQQ